MSSDAINSALIQRALERFPHKIQRIGQQSFQEGRVLEVIQRQPGREYAARVEGNFVYDVSLSFDGQSWKTRCSCPLIEDCKHAYAALARLAARGPGAGNGRAAPPDHWETAIRWRLNRPLSPQEKIEAAKLKKLFQMRLRGQGVPDWDLANLYGLDYHWGAAQLDSFGPATSVGEFCQTLAAYLVSRKARNFGLLAELADLTAAQARVAEIRREEEIDKWRQAFLRLDSQEELAEAKTVDFRLVLSFPKVLLQWKFGESNEFRPAKGTHLRDLIQRFDDNLLEIVPEAIPIWNFINDSSDYAGRPMAEFSLDDEDSTGEVSALLRLPTLNSRILTQSLQPFERPSEPLKWQLKAPTSSGGDYELSLVLADGTQAPDIAQVFSGVPYLYATETRIYTGPAMPDFFHNQSRLFVPAKALETRHAISALFKFGIALPEHLHQKIRQIAPNIFVQCQLLQGCRGEELVVSAKAQLDGACEHFVQGGWQIAQRRSPSRPSEEEDTVTIINRRPLRDFPSWFEQLGLKWEPNERRWQCRVAKNFPDKFLLWYESRPASVTLELDRLLTTLIQNPVTGRVKLHCEEAEVDWFDLKVELNVSDLSLTKEELDLLLNAGGKPVRLGDKGWTRLELTLTPEEEEALARLGMSTKDFKAEPQRLHALQLADKAAARLLPEERVVQLHHRVEELKMRVNPEIPPTVLADLRPYQIEGFHFLAYLTENRFGGVLADDMGLGKTVQALTWLAWLRQRSNGNGNEKEGLPMLAGAVEAKLPTNDPHPHRPSLVVCPKSVMDNWRAETEKFTRSLRVSLWHGSEPDGLTEVYSNCDLLVLNYTQLRLLEDALAKFEFHAIILDEGQYIKNPESQTARAARSLRGSHRLVLSGTPIENKLLDLWSIMAFAMPGILGPKTSFNKRFDPKTDQFARHRLAGRVRPFLLRRTKSQVASELPDRIEEDLYCEMEAEQKTMYQAELKRARLMLLGVKTAQELNNQRFNFLTSLLRLRQICCHPALVNEQLGQCQSAKTAALLDLLTPLVEEGQKALVFSQFTTMLDLLKPELHNRGWPLFYLSGDTENRGQLVSDFQHTEGAAIFLISLKAGGFGLNLTAASYVVLFDPWWNPAVENQAIDRTHRIGQLSKIIAYRLLIKDSIEEKIRQLQKQKSMVAEDVLGDESFAQSLSLVDFQFLFSDQPLTK